MPASKKPRKAPVLKLAAAQARLRKKPIEQYDHRAAQRVNNPHVGLVMSDTDKDSPTAKTYQNRTKREFLDEWVRAVNTDGRFGKWTWAVSKSPADVRGIIGRG